MDLAVIIPAAGASRRYAQAQEAELGLAPDATRSKLDEDLGGRPVLQRTVELFTARPEVRQIIVAGPADGAAFAAFRDRYADKLSMLGARLCVGGPTHRWETVRNALALVDEGCSHVAVHDGARPCASAALIDRVLEAARRFEAVIPAVDVADTLKRVDPAPLETGEPDPLDAVLGAPSGPASAGRQARAVLATVDRTDLVAVQTPQVFTLAVLRRAYAQGDLTGTDDAQLVERLAAQAGGAGGRGDGPVRVVVVPGEATNLKITRPADVVLARAILGLKPPAERPAHLKF